MATKIHPNDIAALADQCDAVLAEAGATRTAPDGFPFANDQQMSWGWHVYHATTRRFGWWLADKYPDLTDAHIETALRRIFT